MKLVKTSPRYAGSGKLMPKEPIVENIQFDIYKFNNRPKPQDKRQILLITCFSEFGCESLALLYCIPRIIQEYPGAYVICVGWHGREYLYRHLIDEFWEIKEEFQWLREYTQAFQHSSKTLKKLEESLINYGQVYQGVSMGRICLGNRCLTCDYFWGSSDEHAVCKCGSSNIDRSLLADIPKHKKNMVKIPRPKENMLFEAKKYLKPNTVGVFARNRACYGRNLRPEFYVKLINLLENNGYNVIWLGEKQSVMSCPVNHIQDFSRLPESRNLELTLAIISQLEFTIQFWTASTRLASMMDIPWLLFESPDQICGNGQEGRRIALTTENNKKKIVLNDYCNVMENELGALNLVDRSIKEMKQDNWDDIIGLVEQPELIASLLSRQEVWKS